VTGAAAHPVCRSDVHANPKHHGLENMYLLPQVMWCVIGDQMNPGGECELDASARSQDPRRAGTRILDTAEGVLIALRGCTLHQAFVEIVQTAKTHNVSTLSLADALVALAQNQTPQDGDDAAFVAARAAWGHLVDRSRSVRFDDEGDGAPGA
jgi:ANTAR domain-containing protein